MPVTIDCSPRDCRFGQSLMWKSSNRFIQLVHEIVMISFLVSFEPPQFIGPTSVPKKRACTLQSVAAALSVVDDSNVSCLFKRQQLCVPLVIVFFESSSRCCGKIKCRSRMRKFLRRVIWKSCQSRRFCPCRTH